MLLTLDHLAVCATTLAEGVAHVESLLGVPLSEGGAHPQMGTHNRLLSLGPDLYLEVIAIDPDAAGPQHPRWFDLDNFSGEPRLTNWIARTDDMAAALATCRIDPGAPMALQRGDLRWQITVPGDGKLPYDGGFPALIQWQGDAHPARNLPFHGCWLEMLEIAHPDSRQLFDTLESMTDLSRVDIRPGPKLAMAAYIRSPAGLRILE